uniref:Uncharacterized protein n=2 Tax=Guillardia theta TaxID=55529 RepID=A0A7S4KL73_GUITH
MSQKVNDVQKIQNPPDDIALHCKDGEVQMTLYITWDMSWSDILDLLKQKFHRACVFSYYDRTSRTEFLINSEDDFDFFCSKIEKFGEATVHIKNATFMPSDFVTDQFLVPSQPFEEESSQTNTSELEIGDVGLLEEKMSFHRRSWFSRFSDCPIPLVYMILFGGSGFVLSVLAVVLGYMFDFNNVAAIAVALPCNIFFLSFWVKEVESGFAFLFRLGVGFLGFYSSLVAMVSFGITKQFFVLAICFLYLLSCFWYVEICIRALGWESWFQGIRNLYNWVIGGCTLVGFRQPEDVEEIQILGEPPPPSIFNAFQTVEERFPGAQWIRPKVGQRVKHIGTCLANLSEKMSPLGPWEEGIIEKKLARQLRKWLVRLGNKTDADFKKFSTLPWGTVTYVGSIGIKVEWDIETIPGIKDAGYYADGEDGFYELVLYQEDDTAKDELYEDGTRIHSGGSRVTSVTTFLLYFSRRFCMLFWYWLAFFAYFGLLYALEYSLTRYAVFQAMGGVQYVAKGQMLNARPGNNVNLHMYCKGPAILSDYDGRPAIVTEAMEGIGQGISMARLQDYVTTKGICCVYDRVGFGWSSNLNDGPRTPRNITNLLKYALLYGTDSVSGSPLSWTLSYQGANNETLTKSIPIKPPFVLLGNSAGALYVRQFAHENPELVAAMILIDPLPAMPTTQGYILSPQQKLLSPFWMNLCLRFLQPMGLVYTLFPNIVYQLFNPSTAFLFNGGHSASYDSFQIMTSFMFVSSWCPAVLNEYQGLYSNPQVGIQTVEQADKAGYSMPTVIWIRNVDNLAGTKSTDKIYPPLQSSVSSRRNSNATSCTNNCLSWQDVGRSLVQYFRNPWIDPFTAAPDIMLGDSTGCVVNNCDEYTAMENAFEINSAVLDIYNMLGYRVNISSTQWKIRMAGIASNFSEAKFKDDLGVVLRQITSEFIFVTSPVQVIRPNVGATVPTPPANKDQYVGFSGTEFGTPNYVPIKNLGTFEVEVYFYGHKQLTVEWATGNLNGNQNALDTTALSRRTVFLHQWQVLEIQEKSCITVSNLSCSFQNIDIFSSTFALPIYGCPQNSYKTGSFCTACPISTTSISGATSLVACFKCDSNGTSPTSGIYQYLSCDGKTCQKCPAETLSSEGSLGLSDCTPIPVITFWLNGPIGNTYTADNVTAQGLGRPSHNPFNKSKFREMLTLVANISYDRITFLGEPQEISNYPESRCEQLRGACIFQFSVMFYASSTELLKTSVARVTGDECKKYDRITCVYPDVNGTAQLWRTKMMYEYQILKIFTETRQSKAAGTCPDKWIVGPKLLIDVDLFKSSFLSVTYACPNKYYQSSSGFCEPCPDMTTSDQGATDIAHCIPYNSFFLTAKDASLTYDSRTRIASGGQTSAQPNAYDINKNPVYYIIRGYSLHPYQIASPASPALGNQISYCSNRLNCFNESEFRVNLSTVLQGKVTANEIRLVKADFCNSTDMYQKRLCGPWPGVAPYNKQCVCANISNSSICYETRGYLHLSLYIGKTANVNSPFQSNVKTASDCAQILQTPDYLNFSANAFLYNPNSLTCWPRVLDLKSENLHSNLFCYSNSPDCRDLVANFAQDKVVAADKLAGTQLYWINTSSCMMNNSFVLEDSSKCDLKSNLNSNPLDIHHYIISLHADNASNLRDAVSILTSAAGNENELKYQFFTNYAILQVMEAEDKSLINGTSAERSLIQSNNFDPHMPYLVETTALCNVSGWARGASCLSTASAMVSSGYAACVFNATLQKVVQVCPAGYAASCGEGLPPECISQNSSHRQASLAFLLPFDSYAKLYFKSNAQLSLCQAATCKYLPADVLLTRVDIGWSSTAGVPSELVLLVFSDGSSQTLNLTHPDQVFTYYIQPVVTQSLSIQSPTALYDLSVFWLEPFGQQFSETRHNEAMKVADILQQDFMARDYNFSCPPTTFRSGRYCTACPYPQVNFGPNGHECRCPVCGDGAVQWQAREQCDDGNLINNDGCSSECTIEVSQVCQGPKNPFTLVGIPSESYYIKDQCNRPGAFWTDFGTASFAPRFGLTATYHRNYTWIFGGIGSNFANFYNDIWIMNETDLCVPRKESQSCANAGPNGGSPVIYHKITSIGDTQPSARGLHGMISFKGKLYLIGGAIANNEQQRNLNQSFDDVFQSDGVPSTGGTVTWTRVGRLPQARCMFSLIEFNNTIVIMGGLYVTTAGGLVANPISNVLAADLRDPQFGRSWALLTETARWGQRYGHTVTIRENLLYLFGGIVGKNAMNDVWRSADGITWIQLTSSTRWGRRGLLSSIYYKQSLWVLGGFNSTMSSTIEPNKFYSDVWVSTGLEKRADGSLADPGEIWQPATENAAWLKRGAFGKEMLLRACLMVGCSPSGVRERSDKQPLAVWRDGLADTGT